MGENPGWPRIVLCMIWAVLLMPFSHGHDGRSQQWRWRKQSKQALIPDKETSMRTDEAMAVEDLHADLMAEIARLRAVLKTIAEHNDDSSDWPHSLENIQTYAQDALGQKGNDDDE